LYRFQRPAIAPQLIYTHDWEEGDFVIFHNRGLMHTLVGTLAEDEVRIMRQCIISGTEMPMGPDGA
jgi:xanthine dioxygenase